MSDYRRDRMFPAFDGGLMEATKLLGGLFVRQTNIQRNAIGKGYRVLAGDQTTLCYVQADRALYALISNPDTEGTSDGDWLRTLTVASGLTPLGTWDIGNAAPELLDEDAADQSGNFYFVTGAASPTSVDIEGLFGDQEVIVKNGDLVVSNGTIWFVNPLNISWDTLDKPQVIIDYVNGTVIAHTHEIVDVNGLQEELDAKYDEGDVASTDDDFDSIPDIMLINLGFLKEHYYRKSQIYSRDEIDGFFDSLDNFYTKTEVDDALTALGDALQTWVGENYYDKATIDSKFALALDGLGITIGEATLAERNAFTGGDIINGYTLAAGHRLLVTDVGIRYVDEFIGTAGQSGAIYWTRLYTYDTPVSLTNVWVDCGTVDLSVSGTSDEMPHPDNGHDGTGPAGAVMRGNTFDITGANSDYSILAGQTARAIVDNPGKTNDPTKWKIMP